MIVATYFALTSLSTVGLGDYYPVSDLERLFGSLMLLAGVLMMSYVLSELRFMIKNFNSLNGEFESKDELEQFFILLEMFNYGKQIDVDLQNRIRMFMSHRWKNDKNGFLVSDNDRSLLAQLPDRVQIQLYTDFIFKDYLWKFRRFFRITNEIESLVKINKFCKYPYYTYDNEMYSSFMISFMNSLETSFYLANDIIAKELDESLEVLFVDKGRYEIGYEINKKQFMCRQYGASTIIGGFQICYNIRFSFIYKAFTQMKCLTIRKNKFLKILDKFPEIRLQMK